MLAALPARLGRPSRAALALVAYGGAIELLQRWVPGRSAEWGDLLADAIGVGLGWAVGRALRRGFSRRSAHPAPPI
jgi:VanZ family protein